MNAAAIQISGARDHCRPIEGLACSRSPDARRNHTRGSTRTLPASRPHRTEFHPTLQTMADSMLEPRALAPDRFACELVEQLFAMRSQRADYLTLNVAYAFAPVDNDRRRRVDCDCPRRAPRLLPVGAAHRLREFRPRKTRRRQPRRSRPAPSARARWRYILSRRCKYSVDVARGAAPLKARAQPRR